MAITRAGRSIAPQEDMAKERISPGDAPAVGTASGIWLAWDSEATKTSGSSVAAGEKDCVSTHELFAELDGSEFVVNGQTWRIEIYGVLDDDGCRWIQLGLTGPRNDMATLRLVKGAGAQQAISALTVWVGQRSTGRNVLNVA